MLERELRLEASQNPARRSVDFFLWMMRGDGGWCGVGSEELTLRAPPTDEEPAAIRFLPLHPMCETPVAFRLSPENAQALMDSLYRAGLRPSQDRGGASTAAALESHLADMRALAFSLLEIQAPNH